MKRDLSDFQYYSKSGRHWLAVYVTRDNVESISKRSGLIEPLSKDNNAFCFGIMSIARVNQWLVLKLDQRNNLPISRNVVYSKIFERDYKYMKRKNEVKK